MMKTLKPTYRKHLILVLLPLAMTIAGAVTFHAFVIHSILTNIAINSIIIATAAFGVMLMLLRVRDIRSEWQIFESFVSSRSAEQSAGKSLVSGLILRLQQIRLSRHASVIEQGQVQETLDHMQEVLDSRQEAAQYVVGLMIALGLLGTFIGLLETLIAVGDLIGGFAKADTSQNIDQALVQLIGTLQYPLTAMGTAFSASMFGLLCSLMLGIMLLSVRAFQADFMQFSRAMTEGMIAEATPPANTEMEADHALLLSRMAELQRLHQALQGEVRALTRQGADTDTRLSQLLAGMERFVSINEKSAQNAESMNAHLASLPALIQLTDRMGHSVEQLAGTVVHAQRQSDLQQQSLAQTLIKHLSLLVAQVETAYGEHARQSHQLFSEMLEQRISAVEVRNAEADIAQQAVMHQHAIFERIFNAISEAHAINATTLQHQKSASEAHIQAIVDLQLAVVEMANQSVANTEKIQASLSTLRHDLVTIEIGQEISRAFERLEVELRTGLGAVLALHRQATRHYSETDSTVKETF